MNVLSKLVIPRITNAIIYITYELEEQEREESFRLKRFKQSMSRKTSREITCKDNIDILKEPHIIEDFRNGMNAQYNNELMYTASETSNAKLTRANETESKFNTQLKDKDIKDAYTFDKYTGLFECKYCKVAPEVLITEFDPKSNVVETPKVTTDFNMKDHLQKLLSHVNQVLKLVDYSKSEMPIRKDIFSYVNIKEILEKTYAASCNYCPHKFLKLFLPEDKTNVLHKPVIGPQDEDLKNPYRKMISNASVSYRCSFFTQMPAPIPYTSPEICDNYTSVENSSNLYCNNSTIYYSFEYTREAPGPSRMNSDKSTFTDNDPISRRSQSYTAVKQLKSSDQSGLNTRNNTSDNDAENVQSSRPLTPESSPLQYVTNKLRNGGENRQIICIKEDLALPSLKHNLPECSISKDPVILQTSKSYTINRKSDIINISDTIPNHSESNITNLNLNSVSTQKDKASVSFGIEEIKDTSNQIYKIFELSRKPRGVAVSNKSTIYQNISTPDITEQIQPNSKSNSKDVTLSNDNNIEVVDTKNDVSSSPVPAMENENESHRANASGNMDTEDIEADVIVFSRVGGYPEPFSCDGRLSSRRISEPLPTNILNTANQEANLPRDPSLPCSATISPAVSNVVGETSTNFDQSGAVDNMDTSCIESNISRTTHSFEVPSNYLQSKDTTICNNAKSTVNKFSSKFTVISSNSPHSNAKLKSTEICISKISSDKVPQSSIPEYVNMEKHNTLNKLLPTTYIYTMNVKSHESLKYFAPAQCCNVQTERRTGYGTYTNQSCDSIDSESEYDIEQISCDFDSKTVFGCAENEANPDMGQSCCSTSKPKYGCIINEQKVCNPPSGYVMNLQKSHDVCKMPGIKTEDDSDDYMCKPKLRCNKPKSRAHSRCVMNAKQSQDSIKSKTSRSGRHKKYYIPIYQKPSRQGKDFKKSHDRVCKPKVGCSMSSKQPPARITSSSTGVIIVDLDLAPSVKDSKTKNCLNKEKKCCKKDTVTPKCSKRKFGLGYFETHFRKIVKISRFKNKDGTITDEKETITIKSEKNYPTKPDDCQSNRTCLSSLMDYEACQQAGDKVTPQCRSAKSDIVKKSNDIKPCPQVRRCISNHKYTGDATEGNVLDFPMSSCANVACVSTNKANINPTCGPFPKSAKPNSGSKLPKPNLEAIGQVCDICNKMKDIGDNASIGTCQNERHIRTENLGVDQDQYCTCPELAPCMTSGPICGNRLKDTDSGPKCRCNDNVINSCRSSKIQFANVGTVISLKNAFKGTIESSDSCSCDQGVCINSNLLCKRKKRSAATDTRCKCPVNSPCSSTAQGAIKLINDKTKCCGETQTRSISGVYASNQENDNCICLDNFPCKSTSLNEPKVSKIDYVSVKKEEEITCCPDHPKMQCTSKDKCKMLPNKETSKNKFDGSCPKGSLCKTSNMICPNKEKERVCEAKRTVDRINSKMMKTDSKAKTKCSSTIRNDTNSRNEVQSCCQKADNKNIGTLKELFDVESKSRGCCPTPAESITFSNISGNSTYIDPKDKSCCKNRRKTKDGKIPCCKKECPGENKCLDKTKKKEINTATSTSELTSCCVPPKLIPENCNKKPYSQKVEVCGSYCALRIIRDTLKSCSCEEMTEEEIYLTDSVVETLKRIFAIEATSQTRPVKNNSENCNTLNEKSDLNCRTSQCKREDTEILCCTNYDNADSKSISVKSGNSSKLHFFPRFLFRSKTETNRCCTQTTPIPSNRSCTRRLTPSGSVRTADGTANCCLQKIDDRTKSYFGPYFNFFACNR